ncbi:hypothetical protein CYMTET_30790 [Cymbomonas tetramitiformis]|uniref:Uncharacterized protein n=1 Tax=Cymbomonas tetramitiformis TaxID=36881 RepID=A0AAE0KTU7_9CHLO|nr:hypothetical protein CYMTET_30790 [Cymbomonas tetramitiformis]
MLGFNFNLLEQLSFYGAYHTKFWNQIIHIIFVPCIFWTSCVFFNYLPPLVDFNVPEPYDKYIQANNGLYLLAAYGLYFLTLEPVAASTWIFSIGSPCYLIATFMSQYVESAWTWALALHVFSWYAQIHPGHIIIEKRKPALLDSLMQSLVLAPFFVWFEILFWAGYRPSLLAEVNKEISKRHKQMAAVAAAKSK